MPFLLQFLWSKYNEHAVLNSFSKCPCESYGKKMRCFLLNFLLEFAFLDFIFCCYFLMKMHSHYLLFLLLRRTWSSGRRSGLSRKRLKKRERTQQSSCWDQKWKNSPGHVTFKLFFAWASLILGCPSCTGRVSVQPSSSCKNTGWNVLCSSHKLAS